MSISVNPLKNHSTNTCPHGLPKGTCPICNKMAGGMGGGSARLKSANEWSWIKCHMVGQMMKAQKQEAQAKALEHHEIMFTKTLGGNITSFIQSTQNILQKIQDSLPKELRATYANLVNATIAPVLNLIAKLPQVAEKVENFINRIREEILAVTEKLTAILGEIKNFIEKKLYNNFKKLTKKILKLFIWGTEEEGSIDEEMEVFKARELKKLKKAVFKIKRKKEKEMNID